MTIELSTLAAGLPMATSFAMASGFVARREGRRRGALNAAMHELRRPLQALSLSLPTSAEGEALESTLAMAVAAMDRLDREINGSALAVRRERVSPRTLVEAAVARWQPAVARSGRRMRLQWSGVDPVLDGDPVAIAQAVDNLISNAIEHGEGAIGVEVEATAGLLRLAVRDRGRGKVDGGRIRTVARARFGGRGRHGHGLSIVRRVAAQHGGSFRLRRLESGAEAILALPLRGEVG